FYGLKPSDGNQHTYDKAAFAYRVPVDKGAPNRIDLFKKISDQMLPGHFEWHDWTTRIVEALCEYPLVAAPGAASAGKTYNIVSFACVWWLCAPEESSVTLVSTSIKSLRRRGWAEVQRISTS